MAIEYTNEFYKDALTLKETIDNLIILDTDLVSPNELRSQYADVIANYPFNDIERSKEISETVTDKTIFRDYDFHPEEIPVKKDFLEMALDSSIDCSVLNNKIIGTTNKYTRLISNTINRYNQLTNRINSNIQRIKDINFICSAYKGFGNIIPIDEINITGNFTYQNNIFTGFSNTRTSVDLTVSNVSGNGYIGNRHVLDNNNEYLYLSDDRGNINNIVDSSISSTFEYSRICSNDFNHANTDNVNYDDRSVRCVISLESKVPFGMIQIDTPNENLNIEDVLISNDGINYVSNLSGEINLGADMYSNFDYVYGSNIICFQSTKYIKLVLSTDDYSFEKLGYSYVENHGSQNRESIKVLNNAIRKCISINKITAYSTSYQKSAMVTPDLAPTTGCNRVAIFANQYIPKDISAHNKNYIKYELIVNGETYEMSPINSNGDKPKIIASNLNNEYLEAGIIFLKENIKNIQLRVTIEPLNELMSPFVGNLKLVLG